MPSDALRHADALVIGEGELVWPEVVNDFARGRWQEIYRGRPADLRGMKAPRWDLIRGRRYGRAVTIATRGCVHRCGYCSIPFLYRRGQRQRPVEEVAREVALMPGKSVVFWDDYLIADRAYALALCRAIAPYRKWWTTQTTMRVAFDEELMAVAAENGCKAVFVGLETVSQHSLDLQAKRFNQVRLYERAVANLHRHGIAIQAAPCSASMATTRGLRAHSTILSRDWHRQRNGRHRRADARHAVLRRDGPYRTPADDGLGPLQRQGRRGLSTKLHVSARAGARGRVVRGSVLLAAVDLRPAPLQVARRYLVEPPAQSWLPPGAPLACGRPLRRRRAAET